MLEIIGLAAIGVMWINAEPMIRLREFYKSDDWFMRLINCCLCSTFWISMIYFGIFYFRVDIMSSSIAAVLAEILCRKINSGL